MVMSFRKWRRILVPVLFACAVADTAAAAVASGRNWQITLDRIECEANVVAVGTRIRYLGPKGPVERPVTQLVDSRGKAFVPKSLVWNRGARATAEWLSSGGVMNLQSEDVGEVRMKFEPGEATGDIRLEFGDIKAIAITRRIDGDVCRSLLKPDQIRAARSVRGSLTGTPERQINVYRAAYPCLVPAGGGLRTIEAEFPPQAPRQLLLFGRGFLPAARQIQSPMGPAPAQTYVYTGPDDLKAVEDEARRAVVADFPEYAKNLVRHSGGGSPKRYFAFNWGTQNAQSGNRVDSVGVYDVRSCMK